MTTRALIPVKNLEESKSRLIAALPDEARRALTLAMLEDLIDALRETPGLEAPVVTTPDATVARRASLAGAGVLLRPEPGLNAALEDGRERLCREGDALLFVLGDVAGARSEDFARLIGEAGKSDLGAWLAPSTDGGTSALLLRPATALPLRFGRDSAARHEEAARAGGVPFHKVELPALSIDLDQPEDLKAFLSTRAVDHERGHCSNRNASTHSAASRRHASTRSRVDIPPHPAARELLDPAQAPKHEESPS